MQLVIRDGRVITTHRDDQNLDGCLRGKYPGCDVVLYDGDFILEPNPENNLDPRTAEQKLLVYRDQRRLAYPPIGDQLDMIYWDQINETTIWQDTVAAVKTLYPKPE